MGDSVIEMNISARDIVKEISNDEYWVLRKHFETYARVQELDIDRNYHPNYYDSDETEEHWISFLSGYMVVRPLLKQLESAHETN